MQLKVWSYRTWKEWMVLRGTSFLISLLHIINLTILHFWSNFGKPQKFVSDTTHMPDHWECGLRDYLGSHNYSFYIRWGKIWRVFPYLRDKDYICMSVCDMVLQCNNVEIFFACIMLCHTSMVVETPPIFPYHFKRECSGPGIGKQIKSHSSFLFVQKMHHWYSSGHFVCSTVISLLPYIQVFVHN